MSYAGGYGMNTMSPYKAGPGGFDNAASFAGGGFFTSPSAGGQMRFSQDPSGGRPNNNERTLTPVTIKQILNASPSPMNDSKFLVDGQELNQIKIVGAIINVNVQSTNIAYTIDDSTGLIDVKIWQGEAEDDSEQQKQRQNLVPGVYARIFGKVQEFNNTKTISGFCIRPLTDFNEIASHLALCALTHLKHTKGDAIQVTDSYANGAVGNIAQTNPNMIGLSNLQNAIMNVFRGNIISENGLSVYEVKQRIGGSYSHDEIKAELSFMAQEGHLYSTCDEDHFSPTGTL